MRKPTECHKVSYKSKAAAKRAATAVVRRTGGRRMSPYWCTQHHAWHLTSRTTR